MPSGKGPACTLCDSGLWCECPRCKTHLRTGDAAACARCGPIADALGEVLRPATAAPGAAIDLDDELFTDRAKFGAVLQHASIAEVSGFSVQDFDSYALVRWSWPAPCSQVTLAWRADGYPAGPTDSRATCRRITRAEYDRHGGVQLDGLAKTSLYFTVFAMGRVGQELAFATGKSAGARGTLLRRTAPAVFYRIKRQWLRRHHMTLELSTEVVIETLPPLVLVAKPGELQPIQPDDGTVVCQLSWLRLAPDEPIRHEIDLGSLRTPLYLRAFFVSTPPGRSYSLVDPPRRQLKVQ